MKIQSKLLKAGILAEILLQADSLSTNSEAGMFSESCVIKRKQCGYLIVVEGLLHPKSVELVSPVSGSGFYNRSGRRPCIPWKCLLRLVF